jgi:calnexin
VQVSGEWEEKHLQTPPTPDTSDKGTHLYTAVIGVDNSVKILVDNVVKKEGSLLSETDFKPPVNPPKTIDDPSDKKPADWVDEPKMDDPASAKPEVRGRDIECGS